MRMGYLEEDIMVIGMMIQISLFHLEELVRQILFKNGMNLPVMHIIIHGNGKDMQKLEQVETII